MSLLRRAAKRDSIERDIIQALEQCGYHVTRLSAPGVPDLLLSRAGQWAVAEVKTGSKPLSPAQVHFHGRARASIPILRSVEDVVAFSRRNV